MASRNGERQPQNSGFVRPTFSLRLGVDPELVVVGERGVVKTRGAMNFISNRKGVKSEVPNWFDIEMWCNLNEDGEPMGPARQLLERYHTGMWLTGMGRLEITPYSYEKNGETIQGEEKKITVEVLPYGNEPYDRQENSNDEEPVTSRRPASSGRQSSPAPSGRSNGRSTTSGRSSAGKQEFEWQKEED